MTEQPFQGYVLAELLQGTPPPGISVQPLRTVKSLLMVNLAATTIYRPDFTDLDPAILELGIPHTAQYYAATFAEPFGRQGYDFEIVGTNATPRDPPDAPRFLDQVNLAPPTPIIAWRRRIRIKDSSLYIEARWSPTSRLTIDIRGVEQVSHPSWTTLLHVGQALGAIGLLTESQGIRRIGRPPGTGVVYTRDEWVAAAPAKWAEAQRRRGGARVRNEDLMQVYGVTRSTWYRNCKDYGHPARLALPSAPTF